MRSALSPRLLRSALLTLSLAALGGTHSAAQSLVGGADHVGLAGATTALGGSGWAVANPAAWSTIDGYWLGLSASEAYSLSELRYGSVHLAAPVFGSVLAMGVQTFGFEDYRETTFIGGGARAFSLGTSRRIHLGASLRVKQISIPNYGSTAAMGLSLGAQVDVLESLTFGVSALNVNGPEVAGGQAMDRTTRFGFAYRADERATLTVDLVQAIQHPVSIHAGVEAIPHPILRLRAGVASEPTRFAGGVGFVAGPLRADLALEIHQDLGESPSLSLQTTF